MCRRTRPHAGPLEGEAVWVDLLGAPVTHGVDLGVIVRVQRDEEGLPPQGRLTLVKHLISAQDCFHVTDRTSLLCVRLYNGVCSSGNAWYNSKSLIIPTVALIWLYMKVGASAAEAGRVETCKKGVEKA